MIRTFPLKHSINKSKQKKIISILLEYRKLATKLASRQWKEFYRNCGFNKNLEVKSVESKLSERYKQTCQYQVVGVLDSFISNRQNDFVKIVWRSQLDGETKRYLFYINKYQKWFADCAQMPVFDENGKKIKDKTEQIPPEAIKLSRAIIKHVLKKHRRPKLKHCNMALDRKVARITPKRKDKKKNAEKFDYWISLSTLKPKHLIALPLTTNEYFEGKKGKFKYFCQINVKEDERINICLIKDVEKREYVPEIPKISLDFGLRNLFTTNHGDLYGRNFIDVLKKYDTYISSLAQNRQRQGLDVKSRRYNALVGILRNFLKNEINRVINQIVRQYHPKEIVVEDLHFSSPHLSRRMNRLLSNMGRKIINEKFKSLEEEFSIVITKVPAPYTSKECSNCGYVDKKNRKKQSEFVCQHCHKKLNADVNGARTILIRSSDKDLCNVYLSKSAILDILIRQFLECYPDMDINSSGLLESNIYFRQYRQYGTNGNIKYG